MAQWYIFVKSPEAKNFTFVARAFHESTKNKKVREYRDKGYEVKAIKFSKAEKAKIRKLPRQWRGAKPLSKRTLFQRAKTEKELGRRG